MLSLGPQVYGFRVRFQGVEDPRGQTGGQVERYERLRGGGGGDGEELGEPEGEFYSGAGFEGVACGVVV